LNNKEVQKFQTVKIGSRDL